MTPKTGARATTAGYASALVPSKLPPAEIARAALVELSRGQKHPPSPGVIGQARTIRSECGLSRGESDHALRRLRLAIPNVSSGAASMSRWAPWTSPSSQGFEPNAFSTDPAHLQRGAVLPERLAASRRNTR
jgi:hypothetical protein